VQGFARSGSLEYCKATRLGQLLLDMQLYEGASDVFRTIADAVQEPHLRLNAMERQITCLAARGAVRDGIARCHQALELAMHDVPRRAHDFARIHELLRTYSGDRSSGVDFASPEALGLHPFQRITDAARALLLQQERKCLEEGRVICAFWTEHLDAQPGLLNVLEPSAVVMILASSSQLFHQAAVRPGVPPAERNRLFALAREHLDTAFEIVERNENTIRTVSSQPAFLGTLYQTSLENYAVSLTTRALPGPTDQMKERANRALEWLLVEEMLLIQEAAGLH
jgi:hypothetical protein